MNDKFINSIGVTMFMQTYTSKQVRRICHIYGQMVYLHTAFPAGVITKESVRTVQASINAARSEFPDQFKDKSFRFFLRGLEKIVKGKPHNQ